MIEVREMRAGEWREYRDARLRSLIGAPDAFGRTHAEEAALTDGEWEQQFAERAATTTYLMAAGPDGSIVGIAQVFNSAEAPETGNVVAMWVEPEHRRHGVARRLLDACVACARARNMTRLQLDVTEGNLGALQLYESAGFVLTGSAAPLRPGSELRAFAMALELN